MSTSTAPSDKSSVDAPAGGDPATSRRGCTRFALALIAVAAAAALIYVVMTAVFIGGAMHDELTPSPKIDISLPPDADCAVARAGNKQLAQARLVLCDLSGADLTGADLTGAALARANLRNANLSSADLSAVDLHNADLSGADLSHADLSYADLTGANLTGANSVGVANWRGTICPDGTKNTASETCEGHMT